MGLGFIMNPASSPAIRRLRKSVRMVMSLMDWYVYASSDANDVSESAAPCLARCTTISTDGSTQTLRLSDAIAEGITSAELFAQTTELFDHVSMVSMTGCHKNVSDASLWRVDPRGLCVRFSSDDPEVLFGFESLSLVLQEKPAMMRIDIDRNCAYQLAQDTPTCTETTDTDTVLRSGTCISI